MPKHTSRLPGQPLQERPWAEPHIPEMLSRALFREPTLARRQRQAQVQVQAQAQRPRVSIQTVEETYSFTHPPTPMYTVSPETEPRFPGIVSPVSPLTPEIQVQSQGNVQGNIQGNNKSITQPQPLQITIEPATPSSEPQHMAHWYFHDQAANHYQEKHVSISTCSAYTTLQPSPGDAEVVAGEERGKGKGKGVRGVRRNAGKSVRKSVKKVKVWLREREEVRGRIRGHLGGMELVIRRGFCGVMERSEIRKEEDEGKEGKRRGGEGRED
ncbi:97714620-cc88-4391-8a12-973c3e93e522-CDS [Sclerotinia trifoliorum]|uniref:97714620-cc88-4391-8a12-973c3e93e522-CDS n=1 Tax=Sclerotinia trifoliorum TaxID=28548 RepID=A0A8H2W6F1_9HELO|nr:97714620-cc88-4391-8a12-973c3e93e522-CDS [Sclerotinia trifoliorum]